MSVDDASQFYFSHAGTFVYPRLFNTGLVIGTATCVFDTMFALDHTSCLIQLPKAVDLRYIIYNPYFEAHTYLELLF